MCCWHSWSISNAKAIMDTVSLEMEGDGIVAIFLVEKCYRIRTETKISDKG